MKVYKTLGFKDTQIEYVPDSPLGYRSVTSEKDSERRRKKDKDKYGLALKPFYDEEPEDPIRL